MITKTKKAAAMTGYGILAGLIAVVSIAALQSTGENTKNLFETTSEKLTVATGIGGGESINPPIEDITPSNFILVNDSDTSITGTPGNDLFIVLGENNGVEGPAKTYTASDISNTTGGFNLSGEITVTDINGRVASSLQETATFQGNGGNDTLIVFGNADLSSIPSGTFSRIFLNSGIRMNANNGLPAEHIEGNNTDSYVEFVGVGTMSIDESIGFTGVTKLIVGPDLDLQLTTAMVNQLSEISGTGIIRPLPEQPVFDISGINIDGTRVILNNGGENQSCKSVLAANPGAPTGLYELDYDGAGGNDPVALYCDMDTNGGGWTMLVASDFDSGQSYITDQNLISGFPDGYSAGTNGVNWINSTNFSGGVNGVIFDTPDDISEIRVVHTGFFGNGGLGKMSIFEYDEISSASGAEFFRSEDAHSSNASGQSVRVNDELVLPRSTVNIINREDIIPIPEGSQNTSVMVEMFRFSGFAYNARFVNVIAVR